jgi:quinoprotein glucose dehydrogenase
MRRTLYGRISGFVWISGTVLAWGLLALPAAAQKGAQNGEWRSYGGDLGNTHYSGLDQISASNFDKLEVAWRFKTTNLGPRLETTWKRRP